LYIFDVVSKPPSPGLFDETIAKVLHFGRETRASYGA
jgi:hypothetical protein